MAREIISTISNPTEIKLQPRVTEAREMRENATDEKGNKLPWDQRPLTRDDKGRQLYTADVVVEQKGTILGDGRVISPVELPEGVTLGSLLSPDGKTTLTIANNYGGFDLNITVNTESLKKL